MVLTWLKYIGVFFGAVLIVAAASIVITQKVSDGPIEFLQGGSFTTGQIVEEPVTDWSFGVGKQTEFELVEFGTSRTAGYIMHDGVAYMTCDLGFMWNRMDGQIRMILNLIYIFKHWHTDAVEDGRARLRIEGKIYKANFVKVEDPKLIEALKLEMEDLARGYIAPAALGPRPNEGPSDVWFFRMDPRS